MLRVGFIPAHNFSINLPWRKISTGIQSERIKAIPSHSSQSEKGLNLVRCKSVEKKFDSLRFNPRLQSE